MTRIRYYPTDKQNIVCTGVLFSHNKVYRVFIAKSDFNGEFLTDIRNRHGATVVAMASSTLEDAKRSARQTLINLGIKFNKERRIRKNE